MAQTNDNETRECLAETLLEACDYVQNKTDQYDQPVEVIRDAVADWLANPPEEEDS